MRIISFMVAASLAAPALSSDRADREGPGSSKDQLVCKREVPVGSLIASRKMCLTKEEWRKRADDGNATARGLVDDGASACGQNGGVCPF